MMYSVYLVRPCGFLCVFYRVGLVTFVFFAACISTRVGRHILICRIAKNWLRHHELTPLIGRHVNLETSSQQKRDIRICIPLSNPLPKQGPRTCHKEFYSVCCYIIERRAFVKIKCRKGIYI